MFQIYRILLLLRTSMQLGFFFGVSTILYRFLAKTYTISILGLDYEISLILLLLLFIVLAGLIFYIPRVTLLITRNIALNSFPQIWGSFSGILKTIGNFIYTGLLGIIILYLLTFINNVPNLFGYIINNDYISIRKPWNLADLTNWVNTIKADFPSVCEADWVALLKNNSPGEMVSSIVSTLSNFKPLIIEQITDIVSQQNHRASYLGYYFNTIIWDNKYIIGGVGLCLLICYIVVTRTPDSTTGILSKMSNFGEKLSKSVSANETLHAQGECIYSLLTDVLAMQKRSLSHDAKMISENLTKTALQKLVLEKAVIGGRSRALFDNLCNIMSNSMLTAAEKEELRVAAQLALQISHKYGY
jgi:hypothetical protein